MSDTITTLIVSESFVGNNSTVTPYPLTIQYSEASHIKLKVDGVVTAGFTVAIDGLRTTVAVPNTSELVVYRETPKNQLVDFPANTTPSAADVSAALNKITLIGQEVGEAADAAAAAILPDGAVTTGKLADLGVTTGKLANNAVTNAKLAAGTLADLAALVYPTNALKFVRVNALATGVELATPAGGGDLLSASNLSDVADPAIALLNLGGINNNSPDTLSSKRITPRMQGEIGGAVVVNTDALDAITFVSLGSNITSVTMNGTPTNFQKFIMRIRDNGTPRTITLGVQFSNQGGVVPATTIANKTTTLTFLWDTFLNAWGCIHVAQEP